MSSPGIFLIQPNGELVEMNEQAYNCEDLLQTLLVKYPSLLASNQIDSKAPRKWLFIEREAGVPSMDGGVTLSEKENLASVDLLAFESNKAFEGLVEVITWAIEEVRTAHPRGTSSTAFKSL